jgi:hypothetical protein
VDLQKTGTPILAKVYFSKDKKPIEMQDASGDDTIIMRLVQPTADKRGTHIQAGGRGDTVIMNFAAHTSTVLYPQERSYAKDSLKNPSPTELYGLYAFVQPTDVDNACAEWMPRAGAEGETCRNLGRETINGRSAVKYELSCYGEVCRLWIDRNLHALVKRETKWNSTELRNIQEGPAAIQLIRGSCWLQQQEYWRHHPAKRTAINGTTSTANCELPERALKGPDGRLLV